MRSKSSFFLLAVLSLVLVSTANSKIVPDNDLYIGVNDKNANSMTQEKFNKILDDVNEIYAPIVESLNAELKFARNWDDGSPIRNHRSRSCRIEHARLPNYAHKSPRVLHCLAWFADVCPSLWASVRCILRLSNGLCQRLISTLVSNFNFSDDFPDVLPPRHKPTRAQHPARR